MEKEVFYGLIAFLAVIVLTSLYVNIEQNSTINEKETKINSLSDDLSKIQSELIISKNNITILSNTLNQKENLISSLKNQVMGLGGQIQELSGQVKDYESVIKDQEQQISSSSQKIEELSQLTESQQSQINSLVSDFSKTLGGGLIQEPYGGSMVLYDSAETYAEKAPLMAQIKDDPEKYYKLGIPFFYFKNSTKLTEQEQTILGEYSGLYDYIFIYKDTTEVKVIYHEIGHIIYKKFFEEIPNNMAMWNDYYNFLKTNNYLSSAYAYTSPKEGFSEEYAYYQTKLNPNQHQQMNIFMYPINDWLK